MTFQLTIFNNCNFAVLISISSNESDHVSSKAPKTTKTKKKKNKKMKVSC